MRLAETSWAPWAGLFIGALAWGAHHQIGSNVVYMTCAPADRWGAFAIGAALLLITIVAAILSWRSRSATNLTGQLIELRRFAAWMSTAGGGLFALAIAFQTMATLLAPTCAR